MTYHYGGFWANIAPVRDPQTHRALYWKFEIFDEENLLFEGRDIDSQAARITVEARIDWLIAEGDRHAA